METVQGWYNHCVVSLYTQSLEPFCTAVFSPWVCLLMAIRKLLQLQVETHVQGWGRGHL